MIFVILISSLLFMLLIPNYLAEPEDVYYVADFTDQIRECDGFENSFFKCDGMNVGFVQAAEDGEGGLGLSGLMEVLADIGNEYSICLKIWKETDLAKEFMYTVSGNICGNLGKEDTPWWPLAKSLNTTECPIPQNTYPVHDMVLSLDFAKDVLRHEFVGEYEIEISIVDELEKQLACYVVPVGISEKSI